jgi:hypothetical protein
VYSDDIRPERQTIRKACPLKSRFILFRLAAVLLGLSVFPLLELACRVIRPETVAPPNAWQQFSGTQPLFELSPDGQHYTVAQNRRQFFAEDQFAAQKPDKGRRVFIFGGSTVQGRPFSIPTSFGTFLKISLQQAAPETQWEVVNCGGISYASYRLLPLMQECLEYQPDLFVVCMGHNEFLEFVTYNRIITAAPAVRQGRHWLDQWRCFQLLRSLFVASPPGVQSAGQQSNSPPAAMLPTEVDALLDYQGGFAEFRRAALHREAIVAAFQANLERMVQLSSGGGVPLLLMLPPSNFSDCPPFKSEFNSTTDLKTQQQVTENLQRARELMAQDVSASLQLLQDTVRMDPAFAFTWYQLGQAQLLASQFDQAKQALQRARDEDVCPLRMTTDLQSVMLNVVQDCDLPFLNVQQFLEDQSRHGILGDLVLVDHIHPSFGSHQKIAFRLVSMVSEILHVPLTSDWQPTAQQAVDQHLQSLDDMYFLKGRRALENLEAWTQGRVDGPVLPESSRAD